MPAASNAVAISLLLAVLGLILAAEADGASADVVVDAVDGPVVESLELQLTIEAAATRATAIFTVMACMTSIVP